MTADLHNSGFSNQISVDFSAFVIDAMSSKYADLNTIWQVMDVRDLKFEDDSIDIAIDKSTLDGKNLLSWLSTVSLISVDYKTS